MFEENLELRRLRDELRLHTEMHVHDRNMQSFMHDMARFDEEDRYAQKCMAELGRYPHGYSLEDMAEKRKQSFDLWLGTPEPKPFFSDRNKELMRNGFADVAQSVRPLAEFSIGLALCPLIWGFRAINKLRGGENEPVGKPLWAATGTWAVVFGLSVMEDQKHPPRPVYQPAYSAPVGTQAQPQTYQQPADAPAQQPQYRSTGALTERFYMAVPGGASYYELQTISQGNYKLAFKRSIPEGRCIEITDGHEGIETAAVRIPAPWKDGGQLDGYIYKDELVPAPACKPVGP